MTDTHGKAIGSILIALRVHRGTPLLLREVPPGVIWFLTLGLLGVGWLVDLFLFRFWLVPGEGDGRRCPARAPGSG